MSELYAPDEPRAFDSLTERQPYEAPVESADPFVGKDGLADAADEVSRGRETRETFRRFVRDPDNLDSPAPRDVTISAETAADALRENRNREAQYEQSELDRVTAAAVDDERGWKLYETQQPTQPEQPGFQETQPQPELQPQPEVAPEQPTSKLARAFQDPEVLAEFQQQYGQSLQQVEQAKSAYQQGVAQAGQAAVVAVLASFPELAGFNDMAQLSGALQIMQRTQPERFQQVANHISRVQGTIQAANQQQQQQQQQQLEAQRQQFSRYADHHDSRTLLNETPEMRTAIQNTLIADAEREGIDKNTLAQIWNSNPVARHSFFQNLLADGLKYRLAQRAVPRATVRPVPNVQRPGITEPPQDRSHYSELSRQFAGRSLTPRQAAALVTAKRAR